MAARRYEPRAAASATSTVGGNAPVVVQSMTNTDTADAVATAAQVAAARRGRLRDRAHHGEQPRAAAARVAGDPRPPPRRARRGGPAGRRLPLQRPHAAARVPGRAPRRSPSTASTPATSGGAPATTRTSRRWCRPPSTTAARCASASTPARSTRSCSTPSWTRTARLEAPLAAEAVLREAMVQSAHLLGGGGRGARPARRT